MGAGAIPWILVSILALVLLLAVVFVFALRKGKQPRTMDYRTYFRMGVVWIPTGLVLSLLPWLLHGEDFSFFGLFFLAVGLGYTLVGLLNRDKWDKKVDVPPTTTKKLIVAIAIGLAAVVLGIFAIELLL